MRKDRRRDIARSDFMYRRKFRWATHCVYCGQVAETQDHVLPLSLAPELDFMTFRHRWQFGQGLNKVPCCRECNSLAGTEPFFSIREKRKYIQGLLRKRYNKTLHSVIWDKDELRELGRTLRSHVIRKQRKLALAELRCSFPAIETRVPL